MLYKVKHIKFKIFNQNFLDKVFFQLQTDFFF